jgi:hypothetical protein
METFDWRKDQPSKMFGKFGKIFTVSSKSNILNSSKRNLKFVKRVIDPNNGEEVAVPKFSTPDGPDVQIFDLSGADITEDSLRIDVLQTSSFK